MTHATPAAAPAALQTADLEHIYDALAEGIDQAPEGRSELMLVKLALLLAQALGDKARFQALLDVASQDL